MLLGLQKTLNYLLEKKFVYWKINIERMSNKNSPILNFRLENEMSKDQVVINLDIVTGLTKNGLGKKENFHARLGGSFITLTREAVDSTESSG